MDKSLLEIINNFQAWKGNPFTLAALLIERHTELIKEKLVAAGFPDAADTL